MVTDVPMIEHVNMQFHCGVPLGGTFLYTATCMCRTKFDSTTILGNGDNKIAGEMLDAYEMGKEVENCVSQTLVYLRRKEYFFERVLTL